MFKKPFINALSAAIYIMLIALLVRATAQINTPDTTILGPIAALSVLVLSAAIMGYLFAGYPLQLYLDGHKKEAVSFFFQTLIIFAVITLIALSVFFVIR